MPDLMWGNDRPVALTEQMAKSLCDRIVDAVVQARQSDLLAQFQKFAQVQLELGQARNDLQRQAEDARREIERKDAEIAALRQYIDKLTSAFSNLTPQVGNVQYTPYNNNGSSVMTHPIPMPPPPVPVPSAPPYQGYQYQTIPTYETVEPTP